MATHSLQELINLDIVLNKSVLTQLHKQNVKIETIIHSCEMMDRNRDGIIHKIDFLTVLQSLGLDTLTRAQKNYLLSTTKVDNDCDLVNYSNLNDLENLYANDDSNSEEKWYEEQSINYSVNPSASNFNNNSLGKWIHNYACPAEIR